MWGFEGRSRTANKPCTPRKRLYSDIFQRYNLLFVPLPQAYVQEKRKERVCRKVVRLAPFFLIFSISYPPSFSRPPPFWSFLRTKVFIWVVVVSLGRSSRGTLNEALRPYKIDICTTLIALNVRRGSRHLLSWSMHSQLLLLRFISRFRQTILYKVRPVEYIIKYILTAVLLK